MGIRLVKKKVEASTSGEGFQAILDSLSGLYANGVQFSYDKDQNGVVVTKGDSLIGIARAEGPLHTIIWAAMSLAEKEA